MASAPEGWLDRVAEAYRRAVVKLPDSFQAVNAQLLRPANELALSVAIGVWAGLGGGRLGYLEDALEAAKSSIDLGPGANVLQRAVALAATARDDAELDVAAGHVANAMTQIGPARVAALIGNPQFGQLRDVVAGMRQQLLTGSLWPSVNSKPAAPNIAAVAPGKRGWVWGAVAATAATGVLLIAAAYAPKRGR